MGKIMSNPTMEASMDDGETAAPGTEIDPDSGDGQDTPEPVEDGGTN